MIIKLKGANFSTNNINALLNSYFVSITGGSCVTAANNISSVSKDSPTYSNTFTVNTDYSVSNVEVTMGGTDITSDAVDKTSGEAGTVITISNLTVTNNLSIKFTYTYNGVEEPDNPGSGDVVDPEEPETTTSLNVLNMNDSDLTWGVTTEAGNTTGEFVTDSTKGVSGYIPVKVGDVIRGGTYRNTTNTDGSNYYPYKSSPVYWYDANKNFLGATPSNPCFKESSTGSNDFILTVPASPSGIAYFRVMINKSYSTNIITINNPRPENYAAYPNPTVLEGTISAPSSTINVFNPADAITTITMDISGTAEDFKAQSDRGVSGFIACSGGDVLRGATYRSDQTSSDTGSECYPFKSSPVYFYDTNLNYLSRTNTFTGSGSDFKVTVPIGAAYFRVMINLTYINTEIVTINNDLPEAFTAYSAA